MVDSGFPHDGVLSNFIIIILAVVVICLSLVGITAGSANDSSTTVVY